MSMNILTPTIVVDPPTPAFITGAAVADQAKYMGDESRRTGHATAVAFPRTTAEVCGAVMAAREQGWSITVSGARTGIAAGAVPEGGLLLSLERMNRVLGLRRTAAGEFFVHCQAGVLLAKLQRSVQEAAFADSATWAPASVAALAALKSERLFYPPDPTETGAALGGTVACNASGAHSFRYGPTRRYVQRLWVVLPDGRRLELERHRQQADAAGKFGLQTATGRTATLVIPNCHWPETKNAAGYYAGPGADLVDLFVGSEGTLGIITEVELRLLPAPETHCAVVTFWPAETDALRFVADLRSKAVELGLEAIEYCGPQALTMLRSRRRQLGAASGVPDCLPAAAAGVVHLDIGCPAKALPTALTAVADIVVAAGADPEVCWSAVEADERERVRVFRHALPETVNAAIAETRKTHPTVTKLGTDMAVPDGRLADIIGLYRTALGAAGLDYVMFGHIGDNHLHVNILPRDPAEYAQGKALYRVFAEAVVGMGGSPAAEHGIGKLKTEFLRVLHGDDGLARMLSIKTLFDPDFVLGPGTLFKAPRTAAKALTAEIRA